MESLSAMAHRRIWGVGSISVAFTAALASSALGFEWTPSGARNYLARLGNDQSRAETSQGWGAQPYFQPEPERRRHRSSKRKTTPSARDAKSAEVSKIERPLFAVISIADQRVSIYNHNGLVDRSVISTGIPGHPTPRGVFTIIGRERFHRSNLYSGAPMPFMQRITWSGIAMHLGVVPGHPASHGCIRLPAGFAAKLWGMTRIGERVVISPHDVGPSEFAHPLLPTPMLRMQGDADKAVSAGVQEASVEPLPPPMINPRQYAEQLKAKAVAESAAAAKAMKEASTSLGEKREAYARAEAELRATQLAYDSAQAKADRAAEAFEKAIDVASARQQEYANATARDEAENSAGNRADADRRAERLNRARNYAEESKRAAEAAKSSADAALTEALARLKTAQTASDAKAAELDDATRRSSDASAASAAASKAEKEAQLRQSPISVLVSKKDRRVYVRQGLAPLFDAPATVRDPEIPLGSHLFIATAANGDGASLRWSVVSLPVRIADDRGERGKRAASRDERAAATPKPHGPASGPGEALERVEIDPEVRDRIAERLWTGGSLIISDQPLSGETSAVGTDLTIKLR